ncbi:unnamed protein product [Zymoseptoria tritici ST99CH_3D1]|nr:unnamed protein product [Zymoseptoria tritici ST99CH_3D1]
MFTSMHSNRAQIEREDSIRASRTDACPILVATGVSAHGLDVKDIKYVINYDPHSTGYGGITEYVHRICTGRIGRCSIQAYSNMSDTSLARLRRQGLAILARMTPAVVFQLAVDSSRLSGRPFVFTLPLMAAVAVRRPNHMFKSRCFFRQLQAGGLRFQHTTTKATGQ